MDDVKNPELRYICEDKGITDENLQTDPEAMARATIARLQFNKKVYNLNITIKMEKKFHQMQLNQYIGIEENLLIVKILILLI